MHRERGEEIQDAGRRRAVIVSELARWLFVNPPADGEH